MLSQSLALTCPPQTVEYCRNWSLGSLWFISIRFTEQHSIRFDEYIISQIVTRFQTGYVSSDMVTKKWIKKLIVITLSPTPSLTCSIYSFFEESLKIPNRVKVVLTSCEGLVLLVAPPIVLTNSVQPTQFDVM